MYTLRRLCTCNVRMTQSRQVSAQFTSWFEKNKNKKLAFVINNVDESVISSCNRVLNCDNTSYPMAFVY